MRVLRKGLNGPDVKLWQEFLSQQGFDIGTADGSFGDRTLQATAEFQRRNGLGSDGVVGSGTLGKAKELGFVEDQSTGGTPAGVSTGASSSLSEQALAQIMPNLGAAKRAEFFPFLTSAMAEFEINTPARQAAFLAQLAHESAEFRFMEEIWGPTAAQRRYEGRRDLGNTQTGDGKRYKGRGPIQVTGRANYKTYGDMLGVDLINNPQLAATPEVGFRIAGVYWKRNNINAPADRQDIVTVTKIINGGTNGLDDRKKYYDRARRVLGVSAGTRSIGGAASATRGVEEDTGPRLTRGLDESGEPVPTAAERNAPEGAAKAGTRGVSGGGGTRSGSAGGGASKGGGTAPAAKAAKGGAKKSAKKAAKKSAGKKSAAKKSAGKKSAAKKSAAKKSVAKKSTAKKSTAKKASSKKSTTKKGAKGAASKKGTRPGASKKSSGKGASKKGAKGGAGRRGGR
jgi:predicted chitinase